MAKQFVFYHHVRSAFEELSSPNGGGVAPGTSFVRPLSRQKRLWARTRLLSAISTLPSKRRKQCSGSVFPMLIFSGTDDQDASADIPAVHHLRVNVMCVRCARRLNQTFGLSCSNSLISNLAQIATIFASCFMVASSRLRSPSAVQGLPGGSRARALWGHMH